MSELEELENREDQEIYEELLEEFFEKFHDYPDEDWPCGCNRPFCMCDNLTLYGEVCEDCLQGIHG